MRGVVFCELLPREQWEGGGEAGGRRPGPGWRWRRPASPAPGLGVSPGHRAVSRELRGLLARESRGRRWRGPGGGRGGARAHPAGTRRATRPGLGSPLPLPAARPRPPSSAAAQVGAGRGAHVGNRAGGGPRGPRGLAGLSPFPLPPSRGGAAPPDARRRRLGRSLGGSPLARPPARGCLGGRDRRRLLRGAGRGRAQRGDGCGGRAGRGAERRGRGRASERAGISAQLGASEPGRGTRIEDRQRPEAAPPPPPG